MARYAKIRWGCRIFLCLGAGRPTLCITPHKDTVHVPNNGDRKEETETTVS